MDRFITDPEPIIGGMERRERGVGGDKGGWGDRSVEWENAGKEDGIALLRTFFRRGIYHGEFYQHWVPGNMPWHLQEGGTFSKNVEGVLVLIMFLAEFINQGTTSVDQEALHCSGLGIRRLFSRKFFRQVRIY